MWAHLTFPSSLSERSHHLFEQIIANLHDTVARFLRKIAVTSRVCIILIDAVVMKLCMRLFKIEIDLARMLRAVNSLREDR